MNMIEQIPASSVVMPAVGRKKLCSSKEAGLLAAASGEALGLSLGVQCDLGGYSSGHTRQ